jgi:hypothetical protein
MNCAHPSVRSTPVLAHTFFPQIPQGLIPVVIKECENFIQMIVVNRSDIFSQLLQSALRLGFAVCVVEDIHQLPDNASKTVDKPLIFSFQLCNGLLFLRR